MSGPSMDGVDLSIISSDGYHEISNILDDNYKIKKLLKNFKFSNFDKTLIKTINWYNKNKIHKIT